MGKRDINAFRERFNRWKNGELVYDKGRPITDDLYVDIMEKVAIENNPKWNRIRQKEGGNVLNEDQELIRILNDNTYDYRGYYNKYPNSRADADTHWTDEFKTAYHPTFSTYSKYSGKKSQYNPEGVLGGHWDGEKYIPAWGLKLPSYYKTYSNGKDAGTITAPVLSVKAGDTVNTELCAEWANKWLRDNGYITYGNAWNLKNVDVLYNGYKGMKKPAEYDRKAIERYNHAAADSVYKNFDSTTLDKSKPYSVNMFYNGSPAQEKAYEQGDNVTGTHTGLLTFNPSRNKWYVTHNIHGTIHLDLFVPLQSGKGKYGVTAIYEPRENTTVNKIKGFFGFEDGKDEYPFATKTLSELVVTESKPKNHFPFPTLDEMVKDSVQYNLMKQLDLLDDELDPMYSYLNYKMLLKNLFPMYGFKNGKDGISNLRWTDQYDRKLIVNDLLTLSTLNLQDSISIYDLALYDRFKKTRTYRKAWKQSSANEFGIDENDAYLGDAVKLWSQTRRGRRASKNAYNDLRKQYTRNVNSIFDAINYVDDFYEKNGKTPTTDHPKLIFKAGRVDGVGNYNRNDNTITFGMSFNKRNDMNASNLAAHEYGHWGDQYLHKPDEYPQNARNLYENRLPDPMHPDFYNEHDSKYWENYADLIGSRASMNSSGIYDSLSGKPITARQIRKYRRKYSNEDRLFRMYDDNSIKQMYDTIVYNPSMQYNLNYNSQSSLI